MMYYLTEVTYFHNTEDVEEKYVDDNEQDFQNGLNALLEDEDYRDVTESYKADFANYLIGCSIIKVYESDDSRIVTYKIRQR